MLEGTALFLLTAERGRNAPTAAGLLAAGATGINAVVLIGYAFGAPLLYGGTIIPTALPTAIAFVLVGVGQFYLAVPGVPALRDWSGASMRGILLRAFLPFMLFFVLVQGWFDLTIQPVLSLNPAVWQSLMALIASVLIVLVIGWIARRTGSEIERAQETLAESEERYRRLFEAAKDGILILDAGTGEIVDVNPFLIELLGYSHTEFLGKQLWKIGLFKDIVANKSAFLKLQEQRYVRYENLPLETKDGRSIWVEFVSNVYEAGDTQVVQCNIRNITERKRAEEMLKESEERFQNAFEYAAIGKALVAPNGRWIRVNRALVEMLGYSREELLTMTFQDITHPDDLETDLVYVRQMLAGEIQTYQMEKRYLHKQGRVVCALLSVSLVRGKENEPLHFISQIQDITERRQAVEALQKSEEQYRALAEGSPDMIFVIDRDD
ncbi:MAG: PAS domain S-box protein, partial [bacterium]|nr:PAS domain S-box protein [bacterium]